TVNEKSGDCFGVTLIPYTLENTTFFRLKPGSAVNLEVDMIARYVHEFAKNTGGNREIDGEFLERHGFK
ncbi:MAG: riboflavin synthase, partial [Deltaproteobacteria bacterium]|nr:riboflavin synthase [Deltaproteobacteria bacterium]